jgi:hypothetical protein
MSKPNSPSGPVNGSAEKTNGSPLSYARLNERGQEAVGPEEYHAAGPSHLEGAVPPTARFASLAVAVASTPAWPVAPVLWLQPEAPVCLPNTSELDLDDGRPAPLCSYLNLERVEIPGRRAMPEPCAPLPEVPDLQFPESTLALREPLTLPVSAPGVSNNFSPVGRWWRAITGSKA